MKRMLNLLLAIGLLCFAAGCGKTITETIDYGDAESFEAALNEGENLEGKIVHFTVKEFHPDSKWGYNLWAGEHLNFISARNPDTKAGDEITVKASVIENIMGSWKITYEKVTDATENENTIYYSAGQHSELNTDSSAQPASQEQSVTAEPQNSNTGTEAETAELTFMNNPYYDILEEARYSAALTYTTLIYKVKAKQSVRAEATMLAYDPEGRVIGKSTSDIELTEGENNYFKFMFESDLTDAVFDTKININKSNYDGDLNAIEMTDYNVAGNDLYVTFKQVKDHPGSFARFKLLFYSGDQIVDDEDGYFSVHAKNLNGTGTTDVAEIWVYGISFDRIEYIYEP